MRQHQTSLRTRFGQKAAFAAIIGCGIACGFSLLAATTDVALAAPAIRYKVVPGKSKFLVRSTTAGLVSHNRTVGAQNFSGEVLFKSGLQPASLQMTVKAASFKSQDKDLSAGDRQKIEQAVRGPILQASKYPNIVFKSTRIRGSKNAQGKYQARILGQLTMHGTTRPVAFGVQGTLRGNSLRASGEISVNQSDYGITLLSLMGGAISVNDDVRLSFDIVATR